MLSFLRDHFGITQERLASWLGTSRGTVAMSETGGRNLPALHALQEARLILAASGKVLGAHGETSTAAPLPSLPSPTRKPLERRLVVCRYQLHNLQRKLKTLQAQAAQFNNRLAALPALRAYAGSVSNPDREAGWLALFEGEAVDGLRDECGAGPQGLLEARVAGLAREIELLEKMLASQPPTP